MTTSVLVLRRSSHWSSIFPAKAVWRSVAPKFAPCSFQNPAAQRHPTTLLQVSQDAPWLSRLHWKSRIPPRVSSSPGEALLSLLLTVEGRFRPTLRVPSRAPARRPFAARVAFRRPG